MGFASQLKQGRKLRTGAPRQNSGLRVELRSLRAEDPAAGDARAPARLGSKPGNSPAREETLELLVLPRQGLIANHLLGTFPRWRNLESKTQWIVGGPVRRSCPSDIWLNRR